MNSISVVIYSYNSENDIEDCITSAKLLSDNCTMIDFESTDDTVARAKKMGVSIHSIPHSNYVEPARNQGIKTADTDWVFILDADERITPELAEEVKKAIASTEYTYYRISRKEYFAKKIWLKHGGWWPNTQVRLIKKSAFKEWPAQIHSFPKIEGEEGQLKNAFLHYSKNDYEQIVKKTINFEDIESELLFKADKPVNTLTFFRKFLGELYRRMFKANGYKDGTIGVIESIYQAFSKTITYLYLYEKKNSRSV
jgi:glycosyltransferase involved in cell wall biosynthesis